MVMYKIDRREVGPGGGSKNRSLGNYRALRLEQARGPSAVARTGQGVERRG